MKASTLPSAAATLRTAPTRHPDAAETHRHIRRERQLVMTALRTTGAPPHASQIPHLVALHAAAVRFLAARGTWLRTPRSFFYRHRRFRLDVCKGLVCVRDWHAGHSLTLGVPGALA